MARLAIRLLGGFQVDLYGAPVVDIKSDKVRALLAFLAVEAGQPHPRDALAWLLWPDSPNQAARTNLRSTLANLRKVIDDPHASPPHLLIHRETIQFNHASDYWLDVSAFASVPAEARIDIAQLEHFESAITLYGGPFLNGFSVSESAPFEEWVVLKREQINRRVMVILNSLATCYEQVGEYEKAQTYAWKLVDLEPWNEEAHQQLIRVLACSGQRSAALAQYEACRRVLAKELDMETSQETTALYEAIREGRLGTSLSTLTMQTRGIQIASSEPVRPPFVGRQAEISLLDGFLEKTLAGQGYVVFITGSSGIGKTALIGEFLRRSMQTYGNLIVTQGKCNAYTGIGDPYLPFLEIMGTLTGDLDAKVSSGIISSQHDRRLYALMHTTIQALVEVGPGLIDRMVPGEALLERALAAARGRGVFLEKLKALVGNLKSGQEGANLLQSDLFEQYTRVLLALAQRHPLILVIDDLQWADIGSISLLFHLGRRLAGSRLLLIGAYRPEEVAYRRDGQRHPLDPVVLEFKRMFGDIQVDLEQSQGREFLEALLDSEPNRLGPAFRETLFQKTNGHPLFTTELLRSLQDRGDLILDDGGRWTEGNTLSWEELPARVEAVIAERMVRLPEELRRILEVASVEGEEFTAEVVASVLGVYESVLVRQLGEQLERNHRLITATKSRRFDGQRISRYRFQHHLYQSYLYSSLDDAERVYLHEAIGHTLERYFQVHPEEMDVLSVQMARQFQEAGIHDKAIAYLRIAGERAERMSASEEAIDHFRHAMDLCLRLPDTIERAQTELALCMALSAQLIASGGYSSDEANKIYIRARQLCQDLFERLGDPCLSASLLVPVLLGLGAFYGHQAQFQAASEIYDQIFALAQASGDPEAMMLAHWGPGYLLVSKGEFASARSHLEKALEHYDLKKHQWLVTVFTLDMGVSCLSWLSWALFFLGYPDQALQRSHEAIALARQISHPFSLAFTLAIASILHRFALDPKKTQELAEEAIDICRQKGFTFWLGVATAYRGLALAWQGEFEEGISQMWEGGRIWRASGANIGLPEYLIDLAEVLGQAGQAEKGMEVLKEALEMIDESGEAIYAAELHRIQGDLSLKLSGETQDEAKACFQNAIDIACKQQARILELRATTSLSRLLLEQGRRDEARERLRNVYTWFTEGFDTRDLESASRLLEELS